MSKKPPRMGSPEWLELVFSSPPSRPLKGHSQRTQYHEFQSAHMPGKVGVQGGNEAYTALALEYLIRRRVLRRAKPQPFSTEHETFGAEIYPDFLTEGTGLAKGLYVIETKSTRFLTREKQLLLDDYRRRFAEYGINYLIWSDKTPLNHSVRHNLRQMRMHANSNVHNEDINKLASRLHVANPPTLEELCSEGFDKNCIYAAAWQCEAFFPITKEIRLTTVVTSYPQDNLVNEFLGKTNNAESWWEQLTVLKMSNQEDVGHVIL